MDTRDEILSSVLKNQPAHRELPQVPMFHRNPESLVSAFEKSLKYMSGEFVDRPPSDFSGWLRNKFPDAKIICSAVSTQGIESRKITRTGRTLTTST